MKNKKKASGIVFLSLILIFIFGSIGTPLNFGTASAEQFLESDGHSGGFIIETEKVEGSMELLGTIAGRITIWDGSISGLIITKVLETGNGQDPLVIKIKSEGPIPVKNLTAQTVNNALPNIGGLCKPSKLGWLCMEDVVMQVEHQTVENIVLENAKIETCYVSECGPLPEFTPMLSKEQLEELLENGFIEGDEREDSQEENKDKDSIEDLVEQIIEQETNLLELDKLLEQVESLITKIIQDNQIGNIKDLLHLLSVSEVERKDFSKLEALINEIRQLLSLADSDLQQLEEKLSTTENQIHSIEESVKDIEKQILLLKDGNQLPVEENETEATNFTDLEYRVNSLEKDNQVFRGKQESFLSQYERLEEELNLVNDSANEIIKLIVDLMNGVGIKVPPLDLGGEYETPNDGGSDKDPPKEKPTNPTDGGSHNNPGDSGSDRGSENNPGDVGNPEDSNDSGSGSDNEEGNEDGEENEEDNGSLIGDLLKLLLGGLLP